VKLADVYDNFCESYSSKKPLKSIEKARRAIVCVGDDLRLQSAVQAVRELIGDSP
jgi:hypothetical protein